VGKKMREISEIAQRILAELDEFIADDLFATINAVMEGRGSRRELDEFLAAIKELVERGYVILGEQDWGFSNQAFLDQVGSLKFMGGLGERFEFHPESPGWGIPGGYRRDARCPAIAATKAGLSLAERIVDERGERWWEQKVQK
jgi:hypothetical protein